MKEEKIDRSTIYQVNLNLDNTSDARIIAYNFIASTSTVLDVGAACGDFGDLLKREKNCQVYGMEYDSDSIEIASKLKAYQQLHQIDLNYFNADDYKEYWGFFDSIVLLDILEHLLEPEHVLASLRKLLKNDGCFIISLPNIAFCDIKASLLDDDFTYTDTGIMDRTHLRFFTYKTIADLLTQLELNIIECKGKINDFGMNNKLPRKIKKFIEKDHHSFVYQYIIKVALHGNANSSIAYNNIVKMQLNSSMVKKNIKSIRIKRNINKLLPVGTLQYKVAKYIKNYFENYWK